MRLTYEPSSEPLRIYVKYLGDRGLGGGDGRLGDPLPARELEEVPAPA